MTGASTQDAASLAHNDRGARLGQLATSWSKLSRQGLSELACNEGLGDQIVVAHRPDSFTSMDKSLLTKAGSVERFRTSDEVMRGLARPQQPQNPAAAALAGARQEGGG